MSALGADLGDLPGARFIGNRSGSGVAGEEFCAVGGKAGVAVDNEPAKAEVFAFLDEDSLGGLTADESGAGGPDDEVAQAALGKVLFVARGDEMTAGRKDDGGEGGVTRIDVSGLS